MPCEEEEEGVVYCVGLVKGQRYLHTPSHGTALLELQFNEFLQSLRIRWKTLSAIEEETRAPCQPSGSVTAVISAQTQVADVGMGLLSHPDTHSASHRGWLHAVFSYPHKTRGCELLVGPSSSIKRVCVVSVHGLFHTQLCGFGGCLSP